VSKVRFLTQENWSSQFCQFLNTRAWFTCYTGWPKSYYVVLKPANNIRFLCRVKVLTKHYSIIR